MREVSASARERHPPCSLPGRPDDAAAGRPGRRRPTPDAHDAQDAGFSLIEALVALAILAIATVGLVGAMEQHIDSTRAMERRSAAMWVAENRLAEIALADPAAGGGAVAMLGERWRVETRERGTDDPEIARVEVRVFAEGEKTPLASLDGFADRPKPVERRL